MQHLEFLTVPQVIQIHEIQIKEFGGSNGMRDLALIESAVFAPQASFGGVYVHNNIYEIAAAYAYYIIKNHAFVDGNKRTGMFSMLTFLDMNNISLEFEEALGLELALDIATSKITIEELAYILQKIDSESHAIK